LKFIRKRACANKLESYVGKQVIESLYVSPTLFIWYSWWWRTSQGFIIMQIYWNSFRIILFDLFSIQHILCEENFYVDILVKLRANSSGHLVIFDELLPCLSHVLLGNVVGVSFSRT